MTALQAVVLGVLQGLTEFIPVSSSAHLVVVPFLLGWQEPGVAFVVALHFGTLLAVTTYFFSDIVSLARALFQSVIRRRMGDPKARLAWMILLATIPAVVAGLLFRRFFEGFFSRPFDVAFLLVVTGALLLVGEAVGKQSRELKRLSRPAALGIGFFQALAILPGISRSGATMSAGLLFSLKREAAAKFAFLLAFPIILGTTIFEARKLFGTGGSTPSVLLLVLGVVSAALAGLVAIRFLLGFVARRGLHVFAAYCIIFGTLVIAYSLVVK